MWILKKAAGHQVARNVLYLYVIQAMDYLLPLITVPYLVRVLGPERYGTVGFGNGFIALLSLLGDYGFSLTATRKVSVQRDDARMLSHTACSVWAAKLLLSTGGFLAILVAVTTVARFHEIAPVVLLLSGRLLGNALSPIWLFQGMERMSVITGIGVLSSSLVAVCIFTLIRDPSDYVLLAGIQGAGTLLAGLSGVGAGIYLFRLRVRMPSLKQVVQVMREGFAVFISTSCVSLYTSANSLILGLLTNDTAVGYYVAAEKIAGAVKGLMAPISQAVYPRLSKLASESKERALYWSGQIMLMMGGLGTILCVGLLVGAPIITRVILGPQYGPSILVMRLLAPLTILVGLSNVFGIQIMLPFGRDKAFTLILLSAGLLNVSLALFLAPRWEAVGMAGAVLISELFVTVTMAVYLLVQGLTPFFGKASATKS